MRIPLKIVRDADRICDADAWFVVGSESRQWLGELEKWDVALDSIELRLIPMSPTNRRVLGALATVGKRGEAGQPNFKKVSPRQVENALPYRRVAGRLFIPADASIVPPASDLELSKLMSFNDGELVWHPTAGLVRIELAERIRVADLLHVPTQKSTNWDCAVAGTSFRSRIVSIQPDQPSTVDDIFREAAEEIGRKSNSLDQLPPTPDEPFGGKLNQWSKPLRDLFRNLKEWTERNAAAKPKPNPTDKSSDQSNFPPTGESGAGGFLSSAGEMLGRGLGFAAIPFLGMAEFAGKIGGRLASLPFIDQLARNREIERLMHLLKSDPDAGLKFALPMGGLGASRGIAPPSNRLMSRAIGFSLGRLGAGGPADLWDIPPDQQAQLIQQYRELAMREIRLGRHRRAAYIYAELLNDLTAAASALESGHHYHEAAALYRDRLNRPVDAANCFERAGLLDEAASILVDVGMFERAADLYVRLDRKEEADRLLKSYAEQLVASGDYRNASRIYHDKLDDVDSALAALDRGWPSSSMAQSCLQESFVLMGLHARHDSAANRIGQLRDEPLDQPTTRLLAKGLFSVFKDYPDRAVRDSAADATQVVIARSLPGLRPTDANELLALIRRLASQDRLLTRDCDRFVQNVQEALRAKSKASNIKSLARCIEEIESARVKLEGTTWHVAKSAGKSVYLAGFEHESLILQRLEWEQLAVQRSPAVWSGISSARRLILEPSPGDAGDVILHPVGVDSIGKRALPTSLGRMMSAGTPTWGTQSTRAMTYEPNGYGWRVREECGSLVLSSFSLRGEPLFVKDLKISFVPDSDTSSPISLCVTPGRIRIGLGPYLCRPILESREEESIVAGHVETLDDEIQALIGSRFGNETWLCALYENEGDLIDDSDHSIRIRIGEGLASPCATFLTSGLFVVAGLGELQVYHLNGSKPRLIDRHPLDDTPVGVVATDKIGQFAVITEDGTIRIFSITLKAR